MRVRSLHARLLWRLMTGWEEGERGGSLLNHMVLRNHCSVAPSRGLTIGLKCLTAGWLQLPVVDLVLATCNGIRLLCERLRIKVPPSFWTTGRLAALIGCVSHNGKCSLPPFRLIYHIPQPNCYPSFSLTCAEDLHFLAVSIVLRPRIDYFDF